MKIIFACDENNGIGKNNSLPWKCENDMKYFKNCTIGNGNNAIIMGSNTAKSIPSEYFPLKNRMNLILTKSMNLDNDNVKTFSDIENIINFTEERNFHDVWIIGGKQIYELFLTKYLNIIDEIHITKIKGNFNCDVHLDINNYLLNFELSKTMAYNDCIIFNHEKYKEL